MGYDRIITMLCRVSCQGKGGGITHHVLEGTHSGGVIHITHSEGSSISPIVEGSMEEGGEWLSHG